MSQHLQYLLSVKDGTELSNIIDIAMYMAVSMRLIAVPIKIETMDDINRIRQNQTQENLFHQVSILGCVYTHLRSKIIPGMLEGVQDEAFRFLIKTECPRWMSQRITGEFYIIKDDEIEIPKDGEKVEKIGGSICISADPSDERVFLVRGFTRPLGQMTMGQTLRVCMTLLPYKGWISYDRTMMALGPASASIKQKLLGVYEEAKKKGKIIYSMDPLDDADAALAEPSADKAVSNITESQREKARRLKEVIRPKIIQDCWVWRRFGYTPAENPAKAILLMTPSGIIASSVIMKDYVPSLDEILDATIQVASTANAALPFILCIDHKPLVDPLNELFAPCGVSIQYYEHASKEETAAAMRSKRF